MPLSPACLLSPSRVALPQQSPSLITHWVKERPSFLGVGRGRASRFMLVCWRGDIHELAYFLGCFQLPVGLCLPTQKSGMGSLPGESEGCVGCERHFATHILFWFDMFRLQFVSAGWCGGKKHRRARKSRLFPKPQWPKPLAGPSARAV